VAAAFPEARVELWAVDEHRIGLKPILHKVWCFDGQRPTAPVKHRFEWRSLVGFVHPASGRTVFHLASTVSIPLFEVELAAFARQVDASPTKQIVLVLDRAGWHTSLHVRVLGACASALSAALFA
jgi:DDE superfamily endonuclease